MDTIEIYLPPNRLQEWLDCCRGLQQYDPDAVDPLLDIVRDTKGDKVKIYIDTSRKGADETVRKDNCGQWKPRQRENSDCPKNCKSPC